jgi:1-acyl-sn-glycerol-3-phosphate acyltransferase
MRLTDENQQELERQMQMAFDQLDNELDPNYHYYMPKKTKRRRFLIGLINFKLSLEL